MRGLNGESLCPSASTTTGVPSLTRLYRSMTSSLVMRMQPEEIAEPMYSGWLGRGKPPGGDPGADVFRLVGAVNAVERVAVTGEQVEAAGAERIVRAGAVE